MITNFASGAEHVHLINFHCECQDPSFIMHCACQRFSCTLYLAYSVPCMSRRCHTCSHKLAEKACYYIASLKKYCDNFKHCIKCICKMGRVKGAWVTSMLIYTELRDSQRNGNVLLTYIFNGIY